MPLENVKNNIALLKYIVQNHSAIKKLCDAVKIEVQKAKAKAKAKAKEKSKEAMRMACEKFYIDDNIRRSDTATYAEGSNMIPTGFFVADYLMNVLSNKIVNNDHVVEIFNSLDFVSLDGTFESVMTANDNDVCKVLQRMIAKLEEKLPELQQQKELEKLRDAEETYRLQLSIITLQEHIGSIMGYSSSEQLQLTDDQQAITLDTQTTAANAANAMNSMKTPEQRK